MYDVVVWAGWTNSSCVFFFFHFCLIGSCGASECSPNHVTDVRFIFSVLLVEDEEP